MAEIEYQGYNGTLIVGDTAVTIKRGLKGVLLGAGALHGDKSIPYASIAAVQLKNAGVSAGCIHFTLVGQPERKEGLLQAATDPNTVMFTSASNAQFEAARQIIEQRILAARSGPVQQSSGAVRQTSGADELAKYAELRDKGIITEEEFQQKKRQILNS